MNNNKKQNILKTLFDHYEDGEKRTGYGKTITELGRSLTNLEIHNRTRISIKDIDRLSITLSNAGHISLQSFDENDKAHRYIITPSGQQAFIDNYYPKLDREIYWGKGKDLLTIIITLGSLVLGIYNYQVQKNNKKEIIGLQEIIKKIKK